MCAERTAEESRQQAVDAMGEDLGVFFHALSNELAWLHLKWGEYVALFGTRPSRIDLMNKAAGDFFRIVQDGLWEDALLHIARLTDSPRSVGKENLSIRGLPPLITKPEVRQAVQESIGKALVSSEFARDWRNRHIAHKDLRLPLVDGAEPLKPASRAAVREALSAVADVLNPISRAYLDSTTMFEGLGANHGAEALLYVLDDGLRTEQDRRDRLKKGELRAEDYARRDL
jgi:hypothetical protein